MKAFCWECNGGTSHSPDCKAPSCPLYVFRSKSTLDPNLWWMQPTKTWKTASVEARGMDPAMLDQEEHND